MTMRILWQPGALCGRITVVRARLVNAHETAVTCKLLETSEHDDTLAIQPLCLPLFGLTSERFPATHQGFIYLGR